MHFSNPELWWVFGSVPAYLLLRLGAGVGARRRLAQFASKEFSAKLAQSLSPFRRRTKVFFVALSLSLLSLCLMGPQWGKRQVVIQKKGRDMVFVVDVSRSMLAEDLLPSRLEKVKIQLSDFTHRLESDRVGIVLFAGSAFVFCPLTLDYGAVRLYIDAISSELIHRQGTELANALDVARSCFNDDDTHKSIVLITDGEDHGNDVSTAALAYRKARIRVFAIGVGAKAGAMIPVRDDEGEIVEYLKDKSGNLVLSKLNESPLRRLAEYTEGQYLYSPFGNLALDQVYDSIQKMNRKSFGEKDITQYKSRFQMFLLPAIALLLLEGWLRDRKTSR